MPTAGRAGGARLEVFPFVVGFGRSGTTLLRVMLDRHPELTIPPESWFITELAAHARSYTSTSGFAVDTFADDLVRHERFVRWRIDGDAVRAALHSARPPDYADAVRVVFGEWARSRGKSRYGDKTPGYASQLGLLGALFPEARFVHVVRDGRDAVLSFTERFRVRLEDAIFRWRTAVTAARAVGPVLGPERYLELHYEDLVADTAGEMRRICAFLRLDYDDDLLRYWEHAEDLYVDSRLHEHLALPPTPGLRDWRTAMARADVEVCQLVAGDLLAELGYDLAPGRPGLRARARVARGWLEPRVRARLRGDSGPGHRGTTAP